jgi:hypothetical protein
VSQFSVGLSDAIDLKTILTGLVAGETAKQ